jgi:hypothetical protein
MQSEVFSGARCVFKLEGKAVGYAVGVSGSTVINYQPLATLGHLEVVEHVPVSYAVELSANLARIAKSTRLASYQNFPGLRSDVEGGLESPQIMPAFGTNGLNILQSGELQAVIYDVVTQSSLYTISGVKASQKNWDIQAGGMVAEQCTFVARIAAEGGQTDGTIGQ